jgi:hypothetical protein
VDECKSNPNPCGNGVCKNLEGKYGCDCPAGFVFTGGTCMDIDECKNNPCGGHGTCHNSEGSYTCTCKNGFKFDNKTCVDINECAENTAKCGPNADCINSPGAFECKCKTGFEGDGVFCTQTEGACATHPCGANAECTNNEDGSSFNCKCIDTRTVPPEEEQKCTQIYYKFNLKGGYKKSYTIPMLSSLDPGEYNPSFGKVGSEVNKKYYIKVHYKIAVEASGSYYHGAIPPTPLFSVSNATPAFSTLSFADGPDAREGDFWIPSDTNVTIDYYSGAYCKWLCAVGKWGRGATLELWLSI